MTNASDGFFSGGKGLLYPLGSEQQWINRPRGGRIVTEPRTEQERDFATKAPKFWDKEQTQPMMQLVFEVVCDGSGPAAQNGWRTDERVDASDDGRRTVYINGKDKKEALGAQIKLHQRPGLRIGDHYYECWTGHRDGKLGQARTWAAMLFPGAGPEQQQFFGNEPQPPAAQHAAPPPGFGQQAAAPAQQSPNWNAPVTGQQYPPQQAPQTHAPAAQGNAYGYGHQPPASPGGQAYAAAQNPAQGFGQPPMPPAGAAPHPGPPPQFQAPQQAAAPAGFGTTAPQEYAPQSVQQHYAPTQQPQGFGQQPVPPVDDPWGQAAPVPNPYGG